MTRETPKELAARGATLLWLLDPDVGLLAILILPPEAAARTRDELWSTIGCLLASVPSGECANYLNHCGYGST